MKKKLVILLVVLAVSLAFTGCDAINGALDSVFMTTPEVKSADLADFTGNTPTTDDEVMAGFMSGMMMAMSPAMDLIPRSLGADYVEVARVLDLTIPGFAELRAVEPESRKATFGVNAVITDEIIKSDYTVGDSVDPGDLTITEVSVKVDASANSIDTVKMTEVEASFEAKLELILNDAKSYSSGAVDATINELNFNVNAKGNAKATLDNEVVQAVDFYAAADVSIGFSLSVPDTNYSGKYIINFNYVQSGTVTKADITSGDITGDAESVSLTIEVYDNNDSLARKVTYTQTQLTELMSSM